VETIKNVVVVIVIGLVGYGVYAAVSNKPAPPPPPEALTDWQTPDSGDMQGFVEMGELEEGGSQGSSTTSLEMPSSLEVPSFGNELPGDAPGSDEALPQTNSPAPSGHNDHNIHAAMLLPMRLPRHMRDMPPGNWGDLTKTITSLTLVHQPLPHRKGARRYHQGVSLPAAN